MCFISNLFDYLLTFILFTGIFITFLQKFRKENCTKIKIFEITTRKDCQDACRLLKAHCQDLNALGFDCEWVSAYGKSRPVALLQLASVHGLCCLFRLNILNEIPSELEEILFNSDIIKLGVSPLNDATLLQQDYNTQVCSTLDLRYLYPAGGGLASLAISELGVKLDKSWQLQCSDWERLELTEAQKDYAAKDAFVAIEIFKKWLLTKNDLLHLYGTKVNDYLLLYQNLKSEISRYLDIHFKPKYLSENLEKFNKNKILESNNNQNQKKVKSDCVVRKSPLYHNCFMHAPDGELLCSCDKRKAQWYVDRGLAEVLPGEPYSIKLLFEPAARASETTGGRFYQQLKQNCCVVCGALQSYLKHSVVPKEYRKHFPNIMKDHQSHDIVLMCIRCHHLAAQHNENLRQELARLCNAPIKASKVTQLRVVQKVKNSAKALINSGDVIPIEKKIQLEQEVKKYFEVDALNLKILNIAANLESKLINENYQSHGIKVVNYFIQKGGGLIKLEILWREYFLNTMKPQYLPALWSVNHNHSRLANTEKKIKNDISSLSYNL